MKKSLEAICDIETQIIESSVGFYPSAEISQRVIKLEEFDPKPL